MSFTWVQLLAHEHDNFERRRRKNSLMIDLLIQVGYVFLVLAVISLFVCTIPIWLVVLLLR
jgi:hypothetical protein